MGKAKLLIAIWTVTALLTLFAVLSLLDGRTRDATEAGIPALLTLGGAVLVTRYRPK